MPRTRNMANMEREIKNKVAKLLIKCLAVEGTTPRFRINPANSDLFAGLIRVFEKGEAPMNENFRFFRDGFLLAYTMWCCTILPSRFQFKFEKMKPQ